MTGSCSTQKVAVTALEQMSASPSGPSVARYEIESTSMAEMNWAVGWAKKVVTACSWVVGQAKLTRSLSRAATAGEWCSS